MQGSGHPAKGNIKARTVTELMQPDPRSASFVRIDATTGKSTPIGIQDAEEVLLAIEASLTPGLPEKIRDRARVARSLILYAWFCYDFYAVSIFWSFSCIEMALRTKYDEVKAADNQVEKHGNFQSLLNWAAGERFLPVNTSADAIRKLRNSMAHPRQFNMVSFPGPAVDCFELLVEMLAKLWPSATEPAITSR
jgi:hypothetical protein